MSVKRGTSSGVTFATKNHTLVRQPFAQGSVDWSQASLNDWVVYERDTTEFLGSHQVENSCSIP